MARVVGEADAATAERSRLVRVFGENESDILERHILWFVLKGDVVESNAPERLPDDFARKLDAAGYWHDAETVLLIGKDGGVKARQAVLDLEALFDRIDAMPMRRAEMRARD